DGAVIGAVWHRLAEFHVAGSPGCRHGDVVDGVHHSPAHLGGDGDAEGGAIDSLGGRQHHEVDEVLLAAGCVVVVTGLGGADLVGDLINARVDPVGVADESRQVQGSGRIDSLDVSGDSSA